MKNKKDNKITKNIINNFILWTLIIVITLTVLNYLDIERKSKKIAYSQFISLINDTNLNIHISELDRKVKLRIKEDLLYLSEVVT